MKAMKENNKFQILWIAIIVLVLLNGSMIAWFTFFGHRADSPERLFLEQVLSFDEKQKESYRVMREEHFSKARSIREHIKLMKEAFFNAMADNSITDDELRKKSAAIGTEVAALDILTFKHFQEVRQMCTPEQKEKFDEIIVEVLRSMDRPGPPGKGERPFGPPSER